MYEYKNFDTNLKKGQKVEESVRDLSQKLLPDCKVFVTDQSDPIERIKYNLVDVVVQKDGHTVLGIECKRNRTKWGICYKLNGWSGNWNTPINVTSWDQYLQAQFPVYIINIQEFAKKAYMADLDTVKNSKFGVDWRVEGRDVHNIDSHTWKVYEGNFTLTDILSDIFRREGLC